MVYKGCINFLRSGYSDWRVPNIKELYSLIDFTGYTGFSRGDFSSGVPANAIPFINTDYFDFEYGDVNAGERYIDAQWLSSTKYVSTTMNRNKTLFGVNFADGRIMDVHGAGAQRSDPKTGRPTSRGPQGDMIRVNNYVRCARGGSVKIRTSAPSKNQSKYPYNLKIYRSAGQEGQRGSKGKSRPPSGGRVFVERLDRNGDGKISRSELDGPKDRFDYHDKNNDGYLAEEETPKGPPLRGGRPPRP